MAATNSDWKNSVREKLISVFKMDAETLTRILYYLDKEDEAYIDRGDTIPPVWKTLKATLSMDNVFQKYAERLAEDTKRAEIDVPFRTTMNLIYTKMMEPLEEPAPNGQFNMVRLADPNVATKSTFMGLIRSWAMIPIATQEAILNVIPKIVINKQAVSSMVNKAGGSIVMVGLSVLYLGYDAIINLRLWWNGEISGKRCAKNIVDSFCTTAAGVVGSVGGAALGSLAGPAGTIVGGIVGGIVSSEAMNFLCDRLTQLVFDIPKSQALENAYKYLGVHMTASNNEINSAYHKLCLEHHPDKGGNKEEFLKLQCHMGVIKQDRGEL